MSWPTLTLRPRSLISPTHCAMVHNSERGASLSPDAVLRRKLRGFPHFSCRLERHFLWHDIPHCTHTHTHDITSTETSLCSATTYADSVALPAFACRCSSKQSISPACRAHSSKPAAAGQTDGQIKRWMDTVPFHRPCIANNVQNLDCAQKPHIPSTTKARSLLPF